MLNLASRQVENIVTASSCDCPTTLLAELYLLNAARNYSVLLRCNTSFKITYYQGSSPSVFMPNATYEYQRRPGSLNSILGSNPFDQVAYPPGPTRQFAMSFANTLRPASSVTSRDIQLTTACPEC